MSVTAGERNEKPLGGVCPYRSGLWGLVFGLWRQKMGIAGGKLDTCSTVSDAIGESREPSGGECQRSLPPSRGMLWLIACKQELNSSSSTMRSGAFVRNPGNYAQQAKGQLPNMVKTSLGIQLSYLRYV